MQAKRVIQWSIREVHGVPAGEKRIASYALCSFKEHRGGERARGARFTPLLSLRRQDGQALGEEFGPTLWKCCMLGIDAEEKVQH